MLGPRLACAIAGEPLLQRTEFLFPKTCSLKTGSHRLTVFGECGRWVIMFSRSGFG
jgi:hypothetical protein